MFIKDSYNRTIWSSYGDYVFVLFNDKSNPNNSRVGIFNFGFTAFNTYIDMIDIDSNQTALDPNSLEMHILTTVKGSIIIVIVSGQMSFKIELFLDDDITITPTNLKRLDEICSEQGSFTLNYLMRSTKRPD